MMLVNVITENLVNSGSLVLLFLAGVSVVTRQNLISDFVLIWRSFCRFVGTFISTVEHLLRGADAIDRAYRKSNGSPFQIPTPGRIHHMVTSPQHLEDINKAPLDALSLHAVAKDFLRPKDTMHGFEWKDVRGIEGTGFVRALRTILTGQLPELLPCLAQVVDKQVSANIESHRVNSEESIVPLYDMCKKLVTKVNCAVFFGPSMAENDEFFDAAYKFPHDSAFAAEFIRLLPEGIGGFVARCFTGNFKSSATLHRLLSAEIRKRLDARDRGRVEGEQQNDGLQWLIDTAPKKENWGVDRLVGEVMGVWYGSVHTLSIAVSFALLDLYSRPEYITTLRSEVLGASLAEFADAKNLPFLDSFLSESARLSAFESTGVRRQALRTFTFRDGHSINRGDWVCVPHRSMMRDNEYFVDALTFDGTRFVRSTGRSGRESFMADASSKWMIWGIGRILCPGRFYATLVLKLVLARFLVDYECGVVPFRGERSMQWRSTVVPKQNIKLRVRKVGSGSLE